MKVKKFLIIFIITCAIATVSNAAIEIKEGKGYHSNITATDAFDYCKNMDATSTLGSNDLDPHLILNADWGAVTYLAYSAYGTCSAYAAKNYSGGASGPTIKLDGKTYYTTTSNRTGVMDFHCSYGYGLYTYTASLLDGGTTNANMASLVKYQGTKYVDTITLGNTRGMAIDETLRLV